MLRDEIYGLGTGEGVLEYFGVRLGECGLLGERLLEYRFPLRGGLLE